MRSVLVSVVCLLLAVSSVTAAQDAEAVVTSYLESEEPAQRAWAAHLIAERRLRGAALRDIVHGYAREANDLGQIFFALYVAVSVTAATRAGTHLAADTLAQRYSATTRRRRWCSSSTRRRAPSAAP